MVYLENIRKIDDLMYCDFIRDVDYDNRDIIKPFKIVYNYKTDTIVETTYDRYSSYTYHVKRKLSELSKLESIPSSAKKCGIKAVINGFLFWRITYVKNKKYPPRVLRSMVPGIIRNCFLFCSRRNRLRSCRLFSFLPGNDL